MTHTDISHHAVSLAGNVTPREAAWRVYKILKEGICADGHSTVSSEMPDNLFASDEETD